MRMVILCCLLFAIGCSTERRYEGVLKDAKSYGNNWYLLTFEDGTEWFVRDCDHRPMFLKHRVRVTCKDGVIESLEDLIPPEPKLRSPEKPKTS